MSAQLPGIVFRLGDRELVLPAMSSETLIGLYPMAIAAGEALTKAKRCNDLAELAAKMSAAVERMVCVIAAALNRNHPDVTTYDLARGLDPAQMAKLFRELVELSTGVRAAEPIVGRA